MKKPLRPKIALVRGEGSASTAPPARTGGFAPPNNGIFESDATPGSRAHVVYVGGRRLLRVEYPAADLDAVLVFLWEYYCDHHCPLALQGGDWGEGRVEPL